MVSRMNGRRLKQYREEAKLTQEELSQMAKVSISMITKLESRRNDATAAVVKRLAGALSLRLPYTINKILVDLVGLEDEGDI